MSLKTAGIDMSRFTAHSTRSSSTSKANPEIAVGYYLEGCGLEEPEYIRYFIQEANMRRKCLSECCTLPQLRYAPIDDLFKGCVN